MPNNCGAMCQQPNLVANLQGTELSSNIVSNAKHKCKLVQIVVPIYVDDFAGPFFAGDREKQPTKVKVGPALEAFCKMFQHPLVNSEE
jgi:hypothetical protein